MAQLFPREIWEEERTLLAPRGASLMFSPTGRLKPQFSCFSVYPHACREGSQFIFPESTCGSLGNIIMGLFLYTHNNPFCRNAFYSHGSFFFFFQWPTLRTLTTHRRSLSFTAINVGSRARGKYFGSRPNISTSNVSPAKVWCLQLLGLLVCQSVLTSGSVPLTPCQATR